MIIAKTNPKESLGQHTKQLLERYEKLKKFYGDQIKHDTVWKLLYLAAKYHDTGKAYTHFQNQMKKFLGEKVASTSHVYIPHGYLSPFFLPLRSLKLNKHHRRILVEAIAYHHERESVLDARQVREIADNDLINHFEKVIADFEKENISIQLPENLNSFNYIEADLARPRIKYELNQENSLIYVLVKGLLHRLDHAASAGVDIELDRDVSFSDLTKRYLQMITDNDKEFLRPLQKYALQNQDKHLLLVAQTGMGKTEAALLWAGKKKTFFTVPLRVSLNALYDRVTEKMAYENAGLLHSTSAHHLNESGRENWEVIYDHSKHFSHKLTFTTIDQILKFPFKFRGYEKYFATLAYSCVIIDEIQAYSPWVVAVIIKALEMIKHIGGKFMIMTATLPAIYIDTLEERGILDHSTMLKEFYDDSMLRHRMHVADDTIFSALEQIVKSGRTKKVLVIVNTIDQATKLFEAIQRKDKSVNSKLFHARFIQKDRQKLESELLSFNEDREKAGVWVTTQIVEASIDIDFDELYTELSPLDSLFQRFGRCYRQRELKTMNENVFIYADEVSGAGSVYDKEILTFSREILTNHIKQSGGELIESVKMKMVSNLYSKERLVGTTYYEEFQKALRQLDFEDYTLSHREAQKQLRGADSVMVIPRDIYDQLTDVFLQLEHEQDKEKRTELRRTIENHTCSVNRRAFQKYLQPIDFYRQTKSGKYPLMNYLFVIDRPYDFNKDTLVGHGLLKEDNHENIFL